MTGFETRPLGRTSLRATILGLGTGTLGGHRLEISRQEAEAVIGAAWSAGVRYFDTAPFYGFGRACRILGDATRELPRDEWVLSTKVGRLLRPHPDPIAPGALRHPMPFETVFDYSYAGVMRSFEDSLQRLGLARIDALYVHDIGVRQHGQDAHPDIIRTFRDGGYRALEELRSCRPCAGDRDRGQRARNTARSDGLGGLGRLPACRTIHAAGAGAARRSAAEMRRSGISVVVGAPFNTGILAGRDTWNYKPAPPEIVARVNAIRAICDSHRVPLVAAALQFPLAHPTVAAILPGPRSVKEFETNARLLRYPIPPALWTDLRTAKLLHPDAPTPS